MPWRLKFKNNLIFLSILALIVISIETQVKAQDFGACPEEIYRGTEQKLMEAPPLVFNFENYGTSVADATENLVFTGARVVNYEWGAEITCNYAGSNLTNISIFISNYPNGYQSCKVGGQETCASSNPNDCKITCEQ